MHKHQDQHCVKMRENTDQNSSEQRHLCSVGFLCRLSMQILLVLLNGSPVFIEPFVCSNFFSLILASHRMSRCSLSRKKSLVFGKFTVVLFQHHQEWYFVFLYFLFFFFQKCMDLILYSRICVCVLLYRSHYHLFLPFRALLCIGVTRDQ